MPLLYMVPSTVLNAETRARRPFLIVFRLSLTSSLSLRMESSTRLPSSVWRVLSDAGDGYGRPAASKSRWTASLLPTLKTKMAMSMLSCTSIAELYASLGAMLQTKLCRDSLGRTRFSLRSFRRIPGRILFTREDWAPDCLGCIDF